MPWLFTLGENNLRDRFVLVVYCGRSPVFTILQSVTTTTLKLLNTPNFQQ